MKLMRPLFLIVTIAAAGSSQTLVDLGSQSKNIDFSSALSVKPFPIGTALPATCGTGETYFKTNAPPGSNLYVCLSNIWLLQGSSTNEAGGGTSANGLFSVTAAGSVLTIGGCSPTAPCRVRIASVVYSFTAPATVTATSGSGTVLIFIAANGSLMVGTTSPGAPDLVCSGCFLASPITSFPVDSVPVAIWNALGGSFTSGSPEGATLIAAPEFIAGPNIQLTQTGTSLTIEAVYTPNIGVPPACDLSVRGQIWLTPGGAGVKDSVFVCAKDATDIYAWRTLY